MTDRPDGDYCPDCGAYWFCDCPLRYERVPAGTITDELVNRTLATFKAGKLVVDPSTGRLPPLRPLPRGRGLQYDPDHPYISDISPVEDGS